MKLRHFIILLFLLSFSQGGYAQFTTSARIKNDLYEDQITDEFGRPMSGVKISVRGKGTQTYSDYNGNFIIKAAKGDLIILSKNGKKIGSYRLNGNMNHEVKTTVDLYDDMPQKTISKKKQKIDVQKNRIYLDSAAYYLYKDSYKSIDFVTRSLDLSSHSSVAILTRSYALLGDNYMQLKQYDLAISNYKTALKTIDDVELKIKLAKALSMHQQYDESTRYYKALLAQSLSNWQAVIVHEGLADNAKKLHKNDTALQYYKKAMTLAKTHKIMPKISSLNVKVAAILANTGQQKEANKRLEKSLRATSDDYIDNRVQVQNTAANIYQRNRDFDNEIKLRKRTLEEFEVAAVESIVVEEATIEKISKSQLNLDIGRAYIDKEEFKKAIPYLEESALEAEKYKDLEVQKNALQKLSELYKKTGNSKKALHNYQEYARIVDELYQQKEEEIQDAINLSKQLQDQQNRINSLEKDRELSTSRLQLSQRDKELKTSNYKRQTLLIYGLLLGLILFAIALFYMYRSNKQKKMANNLLALKSLRSQMNPHFIFNALNSVNSFISKSDERAANRYLTDFSKLMRSVLNNSEEDFISLEKEIELLQLYLKLEHSRFKEKFDYEIKIDANLQISDFKIPPMLLQPYVENAVWHGLRYRKTKGKLQLDLKQEDADTILVSISDNGIGRQQSKALKTPHQKLQKSKGMGNITKRIEILNEMYSNKVTVNICDLLEDKSGTLVELRLKKE